MKLKTDEIKRINQLYAQYRSYNKVAEITGYTQAQIKYYIIKNIPSANPTSILKPIPVELFKNNSLEEVCLLTQEEKEEIIRSVWHAI